MFITVTATLRALRLSWKKKESVKGESWSFMKFEKHTLLKSTPYSI